MPLYMTRTPLFISMNVTPHERLFKFPRWSSAGTSLLSGFLQLDTVLLKWHTCWNKYDSSVSKLELLETNPHYALIQHSDGRQLNVLLRDLAPAGWILNPQEGSPVLEPINFSIDITDNALPDDFSKAQMIGGNSNTNTRLAPKKRENPSMDAGGLFFELWTSYFE